MSNIFALLENRGTIIGIEAKNIEVYMDELKDVGIRGNTAGKLLENIEMTLNALFNKECICEEVIIGSDDGALYGMSIYPTASSLSKIASSICDIRVKTHESVKAVLDEKIRYTVEIDPRILSKSLDFTGAELTAMLLHEIGHITTNTDFFAELKDAYTRAVMDVNNTIKVSDRTIGERDVLAGMLYIMASIEKTHIRTLNADSLRNEMLADKFVYECGYGEALVSVLDKFGKMFCTKYLKVENSSIVVNREAARYAQMSQMFSSRRESVLKLLSIEFTASGSKSIKSIIKYIMNSAKKILIREDSLNIKIHNDADIMLMEGFLSNWLKNPVKVTKSDIDFLRLEIDRIETHDDKSILVYKLHTKLNMLDEAERNIESPKYTDSDKQYYRAQLANFRKTLEEMLKTTMAIKPQKKLEYGIYLKYPKGYEG